MEQHWRDRGRRRPLQCLRALIGSLFFLGCLSADLADAQSQSEDAAMGPAMDPAPPPQTALGQRLDAAFAAGELDGLHAVLIRHGGDVLAERYFAGEDWRWGQPLGMREHGPNTLHDIRSVTKSVVSLLYGVALADGLVPPVDAPLVDQFPEYPDLASDPERRKIEIRHALSMTMGVEWDETISYADPRNSEVAMEMAEDRYRFALEQPILEPPGERWVYNGGATALVAKIIADGAGVPIDAYAKKTLFEPLGIERFDWIHGDDGVPSAASGLRLTLRDLAKIGELVAADGLWEGRRILPSDWIDAAFTPRAFSEGNLRYGYFWWLAAPRDGAEPDAAPIWAAGFGNGGQRLSINRRLGVVIAIMAGNYNDPQAWRLPVKVIVEHAGPAIDARLRDGIGLPGQD